MSRSLEIAEQTDQAELGSPTTEGRAQPAWNEERVARTLEAWFAARLRCLAGVAHVVHGWRHALGAGTEMPAPQPPLE